MTGWICDFCKHGRVVVSFAGILYCEECRMSYGKDVKRVIDFVELVKRLKPTIEQIKKLRNAREEMWSGMTVEEICQQIQQKSMV